MSRTVAKYQARRNLAAAKRLEDAARRERAAAQRLAEANGFFIFFDEIGEHRCTHMCEGMFQCLRPAAHDGEHL